MCPVDFHWNQRLWNWYSKMTRPARYINKHFFMVFRIFVHCSSQDMLRWSKLPKSYLWDRSVKSWNLKGWLTWAVDMSHFWMSWTRYIMKLLRWGCLVKFNLIPAWYQQCFCRDTAHTKWELQFFRRIQNGPYFLNYSHYESPYDRISASLDVELRKHRRDRPGHGHRKWRLHAEQGHRS